MSQFARIFSVLLKHSPGFRKAIQTILPWHPVLKRRILEEEFLSLYVRHYYSEESIKQRKFYNIGAGNQRSAFDLWTYLDLDHSKYSKEGIDIFYDLESLDPLPLPDNEAEVIFNSFVIEHISVDATKNLCSEAFRALKPGGIFHAKVHCFDYALRLLKKNVLTPKVPFECRESIEQVDRFVKHHNGKVKAFFNEKKEYVIQSISDPGAELKFTPENTFLFYNATASMENFQKKYFAEGRCLLDLDPGNPEKFYESVSSFVDPEKRKPHQHNALYFSRMALFEHIKSLGFSEVYFTQPYQSVSPVLWEDSLNPIHKGFLYAIEAVK